MGQPSLAGGLWYAVRDAAERRVQVFSSECDASAILG